MFKYKMMASQVLGPDAQKEKEESPEEEKPADDKPEIKSYDEIAKDMIFLEL